MATSLCKELRLKGKSIYYVIQFGERLRPHLNLMREHWVGIFPPKNCICYSFFLILMINFIHVCKQLFFVYFIIL